MKEQFKRITFKPDTLALVERANGIIGELRDYGEAVELEAEHRKNLSLASDNWAKVEKFLATELK